MIPIATPNEMRAIDAAAPEPLDVLVARAGAAVARAALSMLGSTYGKRVTVIAGKGLNGEDGRVAAAVLERRGVRCRVVTPTEDPSSRSATADLIIDAAYGTGLDRPWSPPVIGEVPVLAVDIPSGIDGLTGQFVHSNTDQPTPLVAGRTITFAALKPGLLLQPGATWAGEVTLADIGLDLGGLQSHLLTDADVQALLPSRSVHAHKWKHAVRVIAGSRGMEGAGWLATAAAARSGGSYTQVWSPIGTDAQRPAEATAVQLPGHGWVEAMAASDARFGSLLIGPGLGLTEDTMAEVRAVIHANELPAVVDADAITALAGGKPVGNPNTVLTPHDGEFRRLMGSPPGADRFESARTAARHWGCVVLLKGPTTIVANPTGDTLVSTSGDVRLATAGTGDVLAGVIAGLLAAGVPAFEAAAAAAHLHGRAASRCSSSMVAGDLLTVLARGLAPLVD